MSETTWESIVQNYQTRAVRDGARIDELRQSTEHWHDTAQMLKRQRNVAEEERDSWKLRAMKAEQERQAAKADAEHWKGEWAVVMGQLGGARAECEALRKDAERLDWMESQQVLRASFYPLCFPPCWVVEASEVTSGETLRVAIDAALAVQPTTGEGV